MKLVGVDVGGTFTDIVYSDTDEKVIFIHKVATIPEDPSIGVAEGISQLLEKHGVSPQAVDHVLHGTTIATNAILEHKGALTGLITTEGYRDILHIGRHQRPQHYSIRQEIPWQNRELIKRRHRLVVRERIIPPSGEVLTPLDEAGVRKAAQALRDAGVQSVAICFLFSYLNPAHENRAAAIVREEFPEAFVTTSAAISPQFREFERFTTAALNAYIGPKVQSYVGRLTGRLKEAGLKADLHIMSSNGGVATADMVSAFPVITLLSGPAAGVLGGAWSGDLSGARNLITFDVGGTSADLGLISEGVYGEASARDTFIAGFPVMVPMIDIHTIGAGGGSIAEVDSAGAYRVGPRSAGAVPGPAAYGRGGQEPTVTDANLVLGRLDKDNFLGGQMRLDAAAAHQVIGALAARLGLSETEAAEGLLTIVNHNMANAIRSRTVQKGIDPRHYTLIAFGGAGPLHGCEVAALMDIPEVIIPPYPGITSAIGLLTTDLKYDAVRTLFQTSENVDMTRLDADFADMEAAVRRQFAADGVADGQITIQRLADMRYVGQGYELRVHLSASPAGQQDVTKAFADFHHLHEAEYGHMFPASPIEIVNLRLSGVGEMPKIAPPQSPRGGSLDAARLRWGNCVFRVDGELQDFSTAFYRRDLLPVAEPFAGPAIILQQDTTTVVPPGATVVADRHGNMIITLSRRSIP
ncbi:MAG: hydantoinase/oxoprolinase family protein [Sphingomonadales bacterium]|nr:hydantoinase/oxoprolinase family protein [Sphingomonadales bacterium]